MAIAAACSAAVALADLPERPVHALAHLVAVVIRRPPRSIGSHAEEVGVGTVRVHREARDHRERAPLREAVARAGPSRDRAVGVRRSPRTCPPPCRRRPRSRGRAPTPASARTGTAPVRPRARRPSVPRGRRSPTAPPRAPGRVPPAGRSAGSPGPARRGRRRRGSRPAPSPGAGRDRRAARSAARTSSGVITRSRRVDRARVGAEQRAEAVARRRHARGRRLGEPRPPPADPRERRAGGELGQRSASSPRRRTRPTVGLDGVGRQEPVRDGGTGPRTSPASWMRPNASRPRRSQARRRSADQRQNPQSSS